jgi:hypothetical protein
MTTDDKRELLRHMVATVVFRGRVAIQDAPESFADFRGSEDTRSPVEILAHIGDLLIGTRHLLSGEMVRLESSALAWSDEIRRFSNAARELDAFLAGDISLAFPVEKFVQGPIGDALTHVGQIVMLRRMAGIPIQPEPYFTAEIIPSQMYGEA